MVIYFNDFKHHMNSDQQKSREKSGEENVWTQERGTKREAREDSVKKNLIVCTGPLMLLRY
jgi:hypothetical protein